MASDTDSTTTRIYGVDVSDPFTQDDWNCLAGRDARFAVVRCWRNANGGEPDDSCPDNVTYARNAGIDDISLYFFPAIRSTDMNDQVSQCLAFLQDNDVQYDRIWLDVEGDTDGDTWYPDVASNVNLIQLWVLLMQQAGVDVGIYCGTSGWQEITGDTTLFSDLPLWWSSHGESFQSFGGWDTPAMVQYGYDTENCGVTYDSDYKDVPAPS